MQDDSLNASILSEPAPCDDCIYRAKCLIKEMACFRFYQYCNEEKWQNAPCIPNKEFYDRLYNEQAI